MQDVGVWSRMSGWGAKGSRIVTTRGRANGGSTPLATILPSCFPWMLILYCWGRTRLVTRSAAPLGCRITCHTLPCRSCLLTLCPSTLPKVDPTHLQGMEVYSTVLWHLKQDVELSYLAQECIAMDR